MSELLEKLVEEKENIKWQQAEDLERYRKGSEEIMVIIRDLESKKKKLESFLDDSLADKLVELKSEIAKSKQTQLNYKNKSSELKVKISDHNKDIEEFESRKTKDEEEITYKNKELADRSESVSAGEKANKEKNTELTLTEIRTRNKKDKVDRILAATEDEQVALTIYGERIQEAWSLL